MKSIIALLLLTFSLTAMAGEHTKIEYKALRLSKCHCSRTTIPGTCTHPISFIGDGAFSMLPTPQIQGW